MKYIFAARTLAACLLMPLVAMAQLQVSFPTSRAVFQRNNTNQATIYITGFYTTAVTQIQAKVTARDGQGSSSPDWVTIQNNPSGGVFAGGLPASGGWYNLEVRAINNGNQVGYTVVERVGIGEVFIVAGQSNAQGVATPQNTRPDVPPSTDDRVNCVRYLYPPGKTDDPPMPSFDRLSSDVEWAAPRGYTSWSWGRLGDLLAARLNVPIMFFNAAYSGTAVRNWRQSAAGGLAESVYIPGLFYQTGQPYINLKVALQFYTHILGVRAVLWQQGEADTDINTDANSYANDLKFVIEKSRQDCGKNVSWVVAKVSRSNDFKTPNPNVIAGQSQVIASTPNVFEGPNTDNIQVPRRRAPLFDDLHFDANGLVEVANAWNGNLNDSFFQRSVPQSPAPAPTVSVACGGGNNLTFTVNGDYSFVQWESGEMSRTLTKGQGLYRAKVKDGLGNTSFTGYVRVPDVPTVSTVDNRPPSVCIGSSLALTANYDNNVTWVNQQNNSTVATGKVYNTTSAGNYYIKYQDVTGCEFTSNVVPVTVNPLPPTPTITNEKPTTFCDRDNTILRTNANSVQYNWSSGQRDQSITVGTSGQYFLTVTDQNGCTSERSNTINVTVNPLPTKPALALSGPLTFCADQSVTLTAPQETAYVWQTGETTRSITVNRPGTFSVQTRNQFGCLSDPSDAVTTTVNPLPETPTVAALGSTTFCAGNRVTLAATTPLNVVWTGGLTSKNIVVEQSGDYSAQARDQNGCLSPRSRAINVTVNPLPNAPTLLTSRQPTLCEGDRITFTVEGPYTVFWSTGDSTKSITTNSAGAYAARVRDVNGCVSPLSNPTTVEVKPLPPAPTIAVIGTYTLQAVNATPLNSEVFRWRRGNDSLAAQTGIIKANQSGSYTARASIAYSPTLTCFSVPSAPFEFTVVTDNRGLSVYPNPNPDKVVIVETQQDLVNATVTVYTLTGQQVYMTTVPAFNERKQLVLTGLQSGNYILRIQATGFDVAKRILLGL
ncbi:hypothetical protein BN8_06292 [Fibrisoma limi BUZ 3]|uniref:T9SS type A sorting domain-containing protein n=1 Tax=Fibrisoma limi BUZ 3 TaxID=1185876 RepID=I2GSM3_9BACT|nr:sialate O-acetylesterase [Fibrisoma limi]CCH56902.1 hypothetical protein BN8_06292 [Fibrisoma limi BUZ 3]